MYTAPFKLGRFEVNGRTVVGRVEGEHIAIISEDDNLNHCIAHGAASAETLRRVLASDATVLAPLDPAARVFAVAINYQAHGVESKARPPARPLIFYKAPSNFVRPGGQIDLNSNVTKQLDYEGEIAVVIGRACRHASTDNALDYVAGACALNDGSARDLVKLQAGDSFWPDWTACKSVDNTSAVGPYIVGGDDVCEALRKRSLRMTTRLNGVVVQDECMDQMIFSVEQIIATLSSYMTLLPGDIIATGTPAGVGAATGRFLRSADALSVEVSGMDLLSMSVE